MIVAHLVVWLGIVLASIFQEVVPMRIGRARGSEQKYYEGIGKPGWVVVRLYPALVRIWAPRTAGGA